MLSTFGASGIDFAHNVAATQHNVNIVKNRTRMLDFISAYRTGGNGENPGAEATRAWLSALSEADATAAAQALIERLVALNRAPLQMRLRLRMLDLFREHAAHLVPELEPRLINAKPPVSGPIRQTAYLIEKLHKELAVGYARCVFKAPPFWPTPGFRRQVLAPLIHAMNSHAQRLALSDALYAPRPQGVWLELHRLYRYACLWQIADHRLKGAASPFEIYREALLLAFAQPEQLGPGDLKRVRNYLRETANLAELRQDAVVIDPAGVFALATHADRPGVGYAKRADAGLAGSRLVLMNEKLLARVQADMDGLRINGAEQPHYLNGTPSPALLARLNESWRGELAPRHNRAQFRPRADLWIGLDEVWRLLHGTPPGNPVIGDWMIVNESPRGFGLKYMSGKLSPIAVGDVVAIRSGLRSKVHACVVRWLHTQGPQHIEVGLQQLASIVVPALYRHSEDTQRKPERVLLLPAVTRRQQAALVAPLSHSMHIDRVMDVEYARGRLRLCATRVIESSNSIQLIEVVRA